MTIRAALNLVSRLWGCSETLCGRQRFCIRSQLRLVALVASGEAHSFRSLGQKLGISHEWARQLVRSHGLTLRALAKPAKPAKQAKPSHRVILICPVCGKAREMARAVAAQFKTMLCRDCYRDLDPEAKLQYGTKDRRQGRSKVLVMCPRCGAQRLLNSSDARVRHTDLCHPCWMKTADRRDSHIVSNRQWKLPL
jgi:RNase P subunit RPR2